MSLKPMEILPVPEETARVARAAFPKGTPFLRLRDELGVIYRDEMFADLFPTRGQPATVPWRLALVSVFQYVEGLSDRQAAEAVRSRIDWKYGLGLELADPGFDFSVLSEFRRRLVDGECGSVLLDADAAVRQMHAFRRHRPGQERMQLAAVEDVMRRAELAFDRCAKRRLGQRSAVIPGNGERITRECCAEERRRVLLLGVVAKHG